MASSIGALISQFEAPSYCTTDIFFNPSTYGNYVTCGTDGSYTRATACFPSNPSNPEVFTRGLPVVYSSAIQCPKGWTSDNEYYDSAFSRTTVTCCPSGMSVVEGTACGKTRMVTTDSSLAWICNGTNLVQSLISVPMTTHITVAAQIQLVGPTPSSVASSSATPGPSLSTTTPTATPSTPGPEPGPGKKLSGGVIAGIAIGAFALLSLLVATILICLRRRKQHQHAVQIESNSEHHQGGDLPEFMAPYTNTPGYQSTTKLPPVMTEKANTPSLRTAVSPVPTTPTQANTVARSTDRTSDVSELASPQPTHYQSNRDANSTTTSTTYPGSPLSELTSFDSPHESQVARLEAEKALLEERIARMRQIAHMEEEQAGMQAELERLRGPGNNRS